MSEGGGFCEKHGPFDPPHTKCPFCAQEDPQRRIFGPPVEATYKPRQRPERMVRPVYPAQGKEAGAEHPAEAEAQGGPQFTEVAPPIEPVEDQTVLEIPPVPEGTRIPLGWLVVKEPESKRGEVLPVLHGQSIGREGDIRWSDPRMSRQHARFTVEPLQNTTHEQFSGTLTFYVWPFAPTNPVIINGQVVRAATPLHENDLIRLGDTLFVFKTLTD